MGKLKFSLLGSFLSLTVGMMSGVMVWGSLFCIVYFDTWPERLLYIAMLLVVVLILTKILDSIYKKIKG
jgi:hypothetical protein